MSILIILDRLTGWNSDKCFTYRQRLALPHTEWTIWIKNESTLNCVCYYTSQKSMGNDFICKVGIIMILHKQMGHFVHIGAWTKWPPFCGRHFSMHNFKGKSHHFDSNFEIWIISPTIFLNEISHEMYFIFKPVFISVFGHELSVRWFETPWRCNILLQHFSLRMESFGMALILELLGSMSSVVGCFVTGDYLSKAPANKCEDWAPIDENYSSNVLQWLEI